MQSKSIRQAIAAMGQELGPEVIGKVNQLFDQEQRLLALQYPALQSDLAYGEHSRQVLDIYGPKNPTEKLPVVLWVHGGGFLRGDKGSNEQWPNANVGRALAQNKVVTAVMNYRLAPDSVWPSGSEDIESAINWLLGNIEQFGGDSRKIILAGTSAGAVHASGYLKLKQDKNESLEVSGVILMSGLYGYTELDERDCLYYGEQSTYAERCPMAAVENCPLPMLVTCSEFDPERFQKEFIGLLNARLNKNGILPKSLIMSGHNHYSMPYHLGSGDKRLEKELIAFVNQVSAS